MQPHKALIDNERRSHIRTDFGALDPTRPFFFFFGPADKVQISLYPPELIYRFGAGSHRGIFLLEKNYCAPHPNSSTSVKLSENNKIRRYTYKPNLWRGLDQNFDPGSGGRLTVERRTVKECSTCPTFSASPT